VRLPVSGLTVRFRAPNGNDDLAILEAVGGAVERALAILPRLTQLAEAANAAHSGGEDTPLGREDTQRVWRSLTVTDFETALLGLRSFLFGDRVACLFRDNSHGCGERMELEFSIAAFLEDARPAAPRGVERPSGDTHWFRLAGHDDAPVRFRLPLVEDQLEVMGKPKSELLLARRCIDSTVLGARARARVERAMEALAPPVSRPLTGNCPACGEPVAIALHVPRLVMEELEAFSAGTHEEVDAIAAAYHWDEAAILAMPQQRRRAYAETIRRREQVGA